MRVKLLAGNWKMNKTSGELEAFFTGLGGPFPGDRVEVMVAAPFTLLAPALRLAEPRGVRIAAQNVHWESSGPFTGEISLPMLKDVGVAATLIGHSERRQYFGETDQTVSKKVRAALAAGVTPVVCVGETLEERERGETGQVVRRQVLAALEGIEALRDLVFAYEPVWAIGTGRTATNDQAQEAHAQIRRIVAERFDAAASDAMRILYGGSANPGNIQGLLAERDIDGALVGGASLKPGDFGAMVKAAL